MDGNDNAVVQLNFLPLERHNLPHQSRRRFEKAAHIIENNARLLGRASQDQDLAFLASR
jgi:hypothetical protein